MDEMKIKNDGDLVFEKIGSDLYVMKNNRYNQSDENVYTSNDFTDLQAMDTKLKYNKRTILMGRRCVRLLNIICLIFGHSRRIEKGDSAYVMHGEHTCLRCNSKVFLQ